MTNLSIYIKRFQFLTHTLSVLALSLTAIAVGHAQTITSESAYVSAVNGSDVNPCTARTAPCRTITRALAVSGRAVLIVDSGDYDQFTITKSHIVETAPGVVAMIHLTQGNGVTITAGTGDLVTLRGLNFDGNSQIVNGVEINSVGSVHIDDCTMRNFQGSAIFANGSASMVDVRNTVVKDSAHGFYLSAPSNWNLVNVSFNGADRAFEVETTSGMSAIVIDHSNFDRGSYGFFLNGPSRVTVRDSSISLYTSYGAYVSNAGAIATFETTFFAWNAYGLVLPTGTALLSNTTFSDNGWAIFNAGGTVYSWGNNQTGGQTTGDISGKITPLGRF